MSESAIGHSDLNTVNNMQAPLLPVGGKIDFGKTFNVEKHILEEENREKNGGTQLSMGPKDESSGQQPKSSNISEDQSI